MVIAREAIYTSVVLTAKAPSLVPPTLQVPGDVSSIEKRLGATVRVAEAVTERGHGVVLDMQKHRLQGILAPGRLEVRCTEDANEKFPLIGVLTWELIRLWQAPGFDKVGYNFGYFVRVDRPAIKSIGDALLKEDELSTKLGGHVSGLGAWLWMEVDGATLWLRLEPRNRDRETEWVSADANFEVMVGPEGPPSAENVADNLGVRKAQLQSLMERIELW